MSSKYRKNSVLNKLRPSSWVMLHETEGFVRLPNERIQYTSPSRTTLSLESVNPRPGSEKLSLESSGGRAYVTNQRVVYLPARPTPEFQSFSAPLLNLQDTYVSAPFFGPNYWSAQVRPIAGGNIPASNVAVKLKMTFRDGGAFDFHTEFERIRDRLQQVIEQVPGGAVDFDQVHLDQLPAYDPSGGVSHEQPPEEPRSFVSQEERPPQLNGECAPSWARGSSTETPQSNPTEPPPGYEEAQQTSVANELENRLRREQQ
ncbi:hypothetical protein FQN51_000507 [Onygenales sp. PD_10]|nr:hypothetical protein FQN51_000507 [Onygenales sp. PD_10]